MLVPLLKTKLHMPASFIQVVDRQALYRQLESGLCGKLSLVAAPAGFGKTTVVSTWARGAQHTIAWVSLDESDSDPALFWAYVVGAFREALGGERKFLEQIELFDLPPVKTLLAYLINAIDELPERVILVLDDYHMISNPDIHQDLMYLIENQPQALHIILITRADPPLSISRLRGHNAMHEIRAVDLRFNSEETAAFLNEVMRLELGGSEIAALEKRTEGWIIGLQLAALSMQNRADKSEFIAAFSGGHHFILEYLTEEVVNHLPEEVRTFLLLTSILDQFNANLCDWVTQHQDGATQLAYLQRQNLFIVPLDDDHLWFRYHHLFRELLYDQLLKTFPQAQVVACYHRASLWYQARNELEEAIKYALLAQDYEQAAAWLEQIVDQVIARGQINTLMQWIAQLPVEIVQARPRMMMHQGWVVFLTGDVNSASKILNQARIALTCVAPDQREILQGRLSAMLSTIIALGRALPSAIAEAQEALSRLPEDEFIFRARAMRALGVSHAFQGAMESALESLETARMVALQGNNKFLAAEIASQIGTVYKHQGKLSLAKAAYQWILDLYSRPEQAPPACLGYVGLAEIALERNELEKMSDYLQAAIRLCQQGNIGYALQPAYLIAGLRKAVTGDQAGAKETIQLGERLSYKGGGSLESILGLAYYQTRFYLHLGELEKATEWATGKCLPGGWTFDNLPLTLDEMHQSLLARLYLARGEFDQVLEIGENIIPQAEAGGRMARVMELNLFRALAWHHLGNVNEALDALVLSLGLAEPESYLRLFFETGDAIGELLQYALDQGVSPTFAAKIIAMLHEDGETNRKPEPLPLTPVESLTVRELQVLNLMCEGYSNQQIADQLIVSVNTVKKHTSNIYGKLGVRNRAQAVLRACEIHLV